MWGRGVLLLPHSCLMQGALTNLVSGPGLLHGGRGWAGS